MEQLEIEIKFFCPNPESVKNIIIETGGASEGRVFEANTLYDRNEELSHRLSVLRLRQDKRSRLTYKEPVKGSDPEFKIVRELEVEVSDIQQMEQILESLGFLVIRKYEKWRETFRIGETILLLDTTPIGVFLELEGRRRDILKLVPMLNMDWKKRIILNYMQMFEIVKEQEGLNFSDLTFDLFKGLNIEADKYAPLFEAG